MSKVYNLTYYLSVDGAFKGTTQQQIANECFDSGTHKHLDCDAVSNIKLARMCLETYFLDYSSDDDGTVFIAIYSNGIYIGQFSFDFYVEVPDPTPDVSLSFLGEIK